MKDYPSAGGEGGVQQGRREGEQLYRNQAPSRDGIACVAGDLQEGRRRGKGEEKSARRLVFLRSVTENS